MASGSPDTGPQGGHGTLHDAHIHLDFIENGEEVARDALRAGSLLFSNSVTPDGYAGACARFAAYPNVRVGLGLHPWWVGDAGQTAELVGQLEGLLDGTRFVGEVGLDFGKRHLSTREAQAGAFRAIARACAERGGKVVSLHAVHAAPEVLDVLVREGAVESCTCIFHWYSGPSDVLKRAIEAGCLFSVGPRMLATKRGREYLKAIPADRMLLETDAPPSPDGTYSFAQVAEQLEHAAAAIAEARGPAAVDEIRRTSERLFAMPDGMPG